MIEHDHAFFSSDSVCLTTLNVPPSTNESLSRPHSSYQSLSRACTPHISTIRDHAGLLQATFRAFRMSFFDRSSSFVIQPSSDDVVRHYDALETIKLIVKPLLEPDWELCKCYHMALLHGRKDASYVIHHRPPH